MKVIITPEGKAREINPLEKPIHTIITLSGKFIINRRYDVQRKIWQAAESKLRTFDIVPNMYTCSNCGGSGSVCESGCCYRPNRDGSCCGNAVPVQKQCPYCESGHIIELFQAGTTYEAEMVDETTVRIIN